MDLDKLNDPEVREKLKTTKTPEDILAIAKEDGYELSDEELAEISGGWGVSAEDLLPQCPSCGSYEVAMSTIFGSPGATRCSCSKCGYTWTRTPFG